MRRPLLLALLLVSVLGAAPASAQVASPVYVEEAGGAATSLAAHDFAVSPGRVVAGAPVVISFRAESGSPSVSARVRIGSASLRLKDVGAGAPVQRRWIPSVSPGSYVARLVVRSGGMKRVRTYPVTVEAAPAPDPEVASPKSGGVFPVRGNAWSFGGPDARFGAGRSGYAHQGQDITAPMGTPIVSPVSGTVYWRKVQADGAGHYLIVRDAAGADYVFMHLVAGSELVEKGDRVRAGQQIAQLGSTGRSSGPHLHFEIWPDGWYAPGSEPIDPLPQLRAWAGLRR